MQYFHKLITYWFILERCWIILGQAWVSSRLHLGCPHRHAAIRPAGLLWLHWHGLSFIVKTWAVGSCYVWVVIPSANTWSQHISSCMPVTHSLPCHTILSDLLSIVQKVSCNAFNLNRLCSCTLSRCPCGLALALHARSHGLAEVHINHREILITSCT